MVKHTVPDSEYQGIMLVNPGGPGGSGLVFSILGNFVPNGAGGAYDWIGFDPRGVGSSVPALSCIPDYQGYNRPDYVPLTRALENTWLARSKSYADACGANGGDLLSHLKTTDVAQDMEDIRTALHQRQINYYGFSYGTYLGQVYATLYPERVRRMVLDSNVDPRAVWYQANLDQDIAFERNMKIWWAWVAQYDSVYHLGTTERAVERLWYAEQDRLRRSPAGGLIGPDEWADIFLGAGYYQITWLGLGDLFASWVANRDPAPLIAAYPAPGNDNGFAMYLAVECTDAAWPTDWSTWRRDNWATYQKAPFETWGNAWFNAPCAFWPAQADRPVDVDGRRVPPILLIDETLDAPTPFPGSLEVRKRFPRSSLLAEPGGTSHAFSLFGNACVDNTVADYLATGKLPPRKPGKGPDTTCDPLPVPVPVSSAATVPALATAGAAASARLQVLTSLIDHGRH
jgi:pimeloyl-ACP methyl ester carboxylesterase